MITQDYEDDYFDDFHEEDDYMSSEQEWLSTCWYRYKDGSYCGRKTIGEGCEQCGTPLCPMHMETGANFCHNCPTPGYRPRY